MPHIVEPITRSIKQNHEIITRLITENLDQNQTDTQYNILNLSKKENVSTL
ncbi:MAG: hypothetical protein P857_99 [Candidatus Xenolissoclinum pacificiensis L6]|uniref:Uncharacterized protein n=1 Tax=Candidatus Xenolissoclinum pacificiensis L6 TaxID=1401685 RepID=W2UYL0_9RICK|nr:MAG: hypothetical protein P857_99 [Candidatus Xenolissoclinum pacificiensis L6]